MVCGEVVTPTDRILSLDVLRGAAVMGILLANLPAFALPEAAYFSPLAAGGTDPADIAVWFGTYLLVEGKMRGLFALLFGASMLLVIERAEGAGRDGASVHYRRMAVLFAIGLLHLYGLWWGDILTHYALCGAIAFLFRGLPVRWLVAVAALLAAWDATQGWGLWAAAREASAHPSAGGARLLADLSRGFGVPPAAELARELAAYRGGYGEVFAFRFSHATGPLQLLFFLGPETLATVLLGMAALRSGFLTGAWPRARYQRWATVGLGLSLTLYAAVGWRTASGGFALADVVFGSMAAPALLRWPAIGGYAALGILLMRPSGCLTERIAAAGRCAFTNYLGTTLVMTSLFYGYGLSLFGHIPRDALPLFAVAAWIAMLAWSAPWLRRYRHGPAEWLWRSFARGRAEAIRRSDEPLLRSMRN